MPAYWAPPPGNMNTTDGSAARRGGGRRPAWPGASRSVGGLVGASRRRRARRCANALAAGEPGEGDVGEVDVGVGAQVGGELGGGAVERRRRCAPDTVISWAGARRARTARPRGASSTITWALVPPAPSPVMPAMRVPPGPGVHGRSSALTKNGLFGKSACGLGASKCRLGGISPCCSASTVLIRPPMPAASPVWPMFDFSEPMAQNCLSSVPSAVRLGQPGDLDRVADQRAGAVGLDVGDVARLDAGDGQRLGDDLRLAGDARREVADLGPPVVVDRRAADDREHVVAVLDGVGQRLEHARAPHGAGDDRAGRLGVERPAVAVGREDLALLVEVAAVSAPATIDRAAGERDVALAAEQALAGQVDGDQRRAARRLHVHARAVQVELVGDAGGEEVGVVAGVAHEPLADRRRRRARWRARS